MRPREIIQEIVEAELEEGEVAYVSYDGSWERGKDGCQPSNTFSVTYIDLDYTLGLDELADYLAAWMRKASPPKTCEEVEDLKAQWLKDPCWDIADTEGFEDHREELEEFQNKTQAQWDRDLEKEDRKLASEFGVRGDGFVDIERFGPRMRGLLWRLESAEEKIRELEMGRRIGY